MHCDEITVVLLAVHCLELFMVSLGELVLRQTLSEGVTLLG